MRHRFRYIAAFAAMAVGLLSQTATAQQWPDRPVTIIVPWGAGGAADALSRMLSPMLEQEFKQPFNVVLRPGGNSVVGHTAIAQARPDGYTIGLGTVEIVMLQHQGLATINHKDFTPFAIINADAGGLIVRTESNYKTARELIEDIKRKPAGALKASGTGQGGIWHLGLIGWLLDEGIDPAKVPWVPSQGAGPAMADVVAGGVDFVTASLPEGRAMIDAGKARPLANMDTKRLGLYPNVPTLTEATGTKWSVLTWRGVFGPKGIPQEVSARLVPALQKAHASQQFQDFMRDRGFGVAWMGPSEAETHMQKSYDDFGRVMKASGMAK